MGGFLGKVTRCAKRNLAVQIDRCDQLTHYLTKIQGPSAASTAAGNGPSAEVASIDGYKVGTGIS